MTDLDPKPLVCVCVPAFNAEATIRESLTSILAQDYSNLKVILVDNASTDRTTEIARALAAKDARLEIVRNAVNIGGEANFTRCIELACGDYTAIYHADDVYSPAMVSEEASFLSRWPGAGAVFTGASEIDAEGKTLGRRRTPPGLSDGRPHDFKDVFAEVLRRGNFMIFPSAMVRTEIYKNEIKAWNGEKFTTSADLDVWLRIAEKHSLGFIDEPLMKYRVSPASYSYNIARLKTSRHPIFQVLEHYVGKYSGALVGQAGMEDYRFLLLKDDINIAVNLLIKGERREARKILGAVFSSGHAATALRSKVQLRIYLIGLAAWVLSLIPLGVAGRRLLGGVRHRG